MRILTGMTFGVTMLACLFAFAREPDEAQFEKMWTDTGFKLESIALMELNPRVCMASEVDYYGCIRAFDSLLTDPGSKKIWGLETSDSLLLLNTFFSDLNLKFKITIEQDLGFFKIISVERIKSSEPVPVDTASEQSRKILVRKKYEKDEPSYWYKLFYANKPEIPYKKLFDWIKKNRITEINEAAVAGKALNTYMAMAINAHDSYEPYAYFTTLMEKDPHLGGIGVSLVQGRDGKFIIEDPVEEGPASLGGLLSGDILVSIDGNGVSGLTLDQVSDHLKGPKGSLVQVIVNRKNTLLSFSMIRIMQESEVRSWLLHAKERGSSNDHKVGYIKIKSFNAGECADTGAAIKNLRARGAQALIFDIRGNLGGDVPQAACTVGLFVGKNKKVMEVRDNEDKLLLPPIMTDSEAIVKVPSIILVDGRSASASEVVAGSLQDFNASVIVGTRTYGKGTMQRISEENSVYFADMGHAKTVGLYFLPGNSLRSPHTPQILGIIPDVEVYIKPNPTEADKVYEREEDYSPVALSNPSKEAPAPRTEVTRYYNQCIKQNGVADSIFNSASNGIERLDYQKLVAIDAAVCAFHKSQKFKK